MPDDMLVICRRCGFGNVPGDQFCGSCGAFLEWEGEAAADAETAALAAMAGGPAVVAPGHVPPGHAAYPGAPSARVLPPDPSAAQTQAWQPAAPVADEEPAADAGLLRCPACGIANPVTRTFCQSCGATLSSASRHSDRSAAAIAAAVEAAPVRASTSPVPPSPPGAAAPRADARTSRGIPGWLLGLVGLGIVVGVVVVVASTLLRGEGPATGASSVPGSGLASGAVGASGSPGPGESASPGGSVAPAEPATLALTGAEASSVVGDRAKFQPEKAIDGDLATAWQEGAATENGEWIEVSFAASRADQLVIRNGYQASSALYAGNLRLKDVLISVNGGAPIEVRLKDTKKAQTIDLGGVSGATTVRITIVSTYAAKKNAVQGTPFDDAAVSELKVIGVAGG